MRSSPKIVIGVISWDFSRPRGGLGRAMQETVTALRALGHTVHVLEPHGSKILRMTRFSGGHLLFSMLLPFLLPSFLRRHKMQCLLFPVGPGGIFLRNARRNIKRIAIVYHTYGQQARFVPGESWKRVFLPFERRTLRSADAVFCYAADTASFLRESGAVDRARIYLLPQLFDAARWESQAGARKISGRCIAVMRLDRRKGFEILLRAWRLVRGCLPRATLLFVGSGRGERLLRKSMRGDPSILHASSLDQKSLRALLSEAEVAVCPAFLEGFGLAAREAQAAGTALVACDSPGLREAIESGRTGLLAPSGDAVSLATAMMDLLRHPEKRRLLSDAAAQAVRRKYAHEPTLQALQQALLSVCSVPSCVTSFE